MKKAKGPVKLVILIFFAMFTINTAVMYILFGINILKPVNNSESREASGKNGANNSWVTPGYNPRWKTDSGYNQVAGEDVNGESGSDYTDVAGEAGGDTAGNAATDGAGDGTGTSDDRNNESRVTDGSDGLHDPNGLYLTESQVADLGELDIKDKLSAVAIISKVGSDESNRIYDMAMDGVTYGELQEIEKILGRYLSADEIDSIKNIIDKSITSNPNNNLNNNLNNNPNSSQNSTSRQETRPEVASE